MRHKRETEQDEMRPEYDFDYSKAVRGKYFRRLLKEGTNVVVLEPDIAKAFPTSRAVNEALSGLLELTKKTSRITRRSAQTRTKAARVG